MKKFDPRWLPYIGAIVQAVLFSLAGNRYFGGLAGWVIGAGVGAVVNPSLAYAASRYGDVSEKRKPLARLALIGMIIVSPTTIALSLYLPSSVFASIAWAMAADLAIVLAGAIAGQSLMASAEKPKKAAKVAGKSEKLARKKKQVARKPMTDENLLAYLQSNPGARQQQVADNFGVTRQAIGPRVKKLYEVKQ